MVEVGECVGGDVLVAGFFQGEGDGLEVDLGGNLHFLPAVEGEHGAGRDGSGAARKGRE